MILIDDMVFNPHIVNVHPGDRIVWVNRDLVVHTATQTRGLFDSKDIQPQASWSVVAGPPGTYAYDCLFHPTMSGKVVVQSLKRAGEVDDGSP
jgi:plastocyanin